MTKAAAKMKIIREICIAGAVIDVIVKSNALSAAKTRQPKCNPTREAVIKNNDRIAERNLARLLNANFYPGDWHVTLTYAGDEPSQAAAKKIIKNFKKRMKREYEKLGLEFRWIEVTEFKNHRIHHHMVVSYIDLQIIKRQWPYGTVRVTSLNRSRNYRKLAEYLVKETSKTMREPGNETKKRWSASRNLVRPVVKREIVTVRKLFESPKSFKGYEIDQGSVHRYEHPFTGLEHLEYMMLSTDPVPRLKTWRKGKIVDRDETYKRATQIQIDIGSLEGWSFI